MHDGEIPVQVDVDLGSVCEADLDLVTAVVELDTAHGSVTGLGQRGSARPVDVVAGDRTVAPGVLGGGVGGTAGQHSGDGGDGDDGRGSLHGDHGPRLILSGT